MPQLLLTPEIWHQKYITYEKPYVERLWCQDGVNRIYLHKIHRCKPVEAFFHFHPWPSAMKIVRGAYEMRVDAVVDATNADHCELKDMLYLVLSEGSTYQMTNKNVRHSVMPVDEYTMTVMVTGPAYENHHVDTAVIKNPDLTEGQVYFMFSEFKRHYPASSS